MSALEVGQELVKYCNEGKGMDAVEKLYDTNCVSIEAMAGGPLDQTMTGKEAILGKNKWWYENHEVHSVSVQGPFPHGDRFAVFFDFDVTNKMANQRMKMQEVGLYTVANNKITKEEFFYHMG